MISDREQHCIYSFDIPIKNLALFLGTVGESGFEDGPVSTARFSARFSGPVVLCSRGQVLYIAENPTENQGAARVALPLSGIKKIQIHLGKNCRVLRDDFKKRENGPPERRSIISTKDLQC